MKKVINKRYQEIEGQERPIFPCVEIEVLEDELFSARSYFFIHKENKETNMIDIYVALMKKVYRIVKDEPQEEILEYFTTKFMIEGVQCIRWAQVSKDFVDSKGEQIFKLVDSVHESDFPKLSKYI